MQSAQPEPGSFRDPSGHIWHVQNRIFRTVKGPARASFEMAKDSGLFDVSFVHGAIINTTINQDPSIIDQIDEDFELLLEHDKIGLVNYPYEWCFDQLKQAALLHLEILREALDRNIALSDASAYNIQFIGTTPYFIDMLSFRPYQEGEVWNGYRQFCEQFLNPLLLQSETGVSFNNWYKGALEGISGQDLIRLLPLRKKLKPKIAAHIWLPASLQKNAEHKSLQQMAAKETRQALPKSSMRNIFVSLYEWINKLSDGEDKKSTWSDYEKNNSYSDQETSAKTAFLERAIRESQPETVWDIGCNSGQFSEVCLNAGAKNAVGFDFDLKTVGMAFQRSKDKRLNLLTLHQDLANPSPAHGWNGTERKSLMSRANADMSIALALVHHLAIGRNIPLAYFAEWLTRLAPEGIVEFVPKNDPMVQVLLKNREDIFPDYTLENFKLALKAFANIIRSDVITEDGRTLIHFIRNDA